MIVSLLLLWSCLPVDQLKNAKNSITKKFSAIYNPGQLSKSLKTWFRQNNWLAIQKMLCQKQQHGSIMFVLELVMRFSFMKNFFLVTFSLRRKDFFKDIWQSSCFGKSLLFPRNYYYNLHNIILHLLKFSWVNMTIQCIAELWPVEDDVTWLLYLGLFLRHLLSHVTTLH